MQAIETTRVPEANCSDLVIAGPGKELVPAVLEAMRSIAAGRERERAMKEMMYSSSKLRSRLAAKNESVAFCAAESASVPAYLRQKPAQGKGDV